MKCINCGQEMEYSEEFVEDLWHSGCYHLFKEHECKNCGITFTNNEWEIPDKFKPTEKQIKTVMFITNRLEVEEDTEKLITKKQYCNFISKYFDKAKDIPYRNDEDSLYLGYRW